jgi:hypothetical protein
MAEITWTLAYRNPRANRFQRVTNWSGTWHQAYYLAQALGQERPDLQVYYVTTEQSEHEQRVRLTAEVHDGKISLDLAMSYLEDHGNILVAETRRRVRMFETGQLSEAVLAQAMDATEARAKYEDNGRPARHLA